MVNSLSYMECVVSFKVSHIMTPNDDDVVEHINRNAKGRMAKSIEN